MAISTPDAILLFRQHLAGLVTFTDPEWALFESRLYRRDLGKKENLVAPGQVCDEVAFIVKGSFRFYFVKDGNEISNYFCFPGEMVSSYQGFLTREVPPKMTLVA